MFKLLFYCSPGLFFQVPMTSPLQNYFKKAFLYWLQVYIVYHADEESTCPVQFSPHIYIDLSSTVFPAYIYIYLFSYVITWYPYRHYKCQLDAHKIYPEQQYLGIRIVAHKHPSVNNTIASLFSSQGYRYEMHVSSRNV